MATRRTPLPARFALAAVVALATLAACELAARWWLGRIGPIAAPVQVSEGDVGAKNQAVADRIYVRDPDTFFALRPGLDLATTENPRIFDVQTNSLGLRGAEVELPKPPGLVRVLCVGDSCTFGSGAGTEETWPEWLERRLARDLDESVVESVNAGVPGYTSFQVRAYLRTRGFELEPDAVVVAIGFNDTSKSRSGENRKFAADLALTDREYAESLREEQGLALVRLARRLVLQRVAVQPASGPDYRPRVPIEEYGSYLADIAAEVRARGALPVFVVWPVVGQAGGPHLLDREGKVVAYQQRMRRVAREADVPLVDLVPAFAGKKDLFVDGVHLSATGYRLVSDLVARELAQLLAERATASR